MMLGHQNATTRPGGRVLVSGTREGEGNTRMCPQGHVLVFGMKGLDLVGGGWVG